MRIEFNSLLFLSNELINPRWQRELKLPLHFITFAFVKARMYVHKRNQGTFILPNDVKQSWGNTVAYGALFTLQDFHFYIRTLDAYHMCSMSTLMTNHKRDIHHRIEVEVTPITFATLDDFARLKYREREALKAITYVGNLNHPNIHQRINVRQISHRIVDGVDKQHFIDLTREVMP